MIVRRCRCLSSLPTSQRTMVGKVIKKSTAVKAMAGVVLFCLALSIYYTSSLRHKQSQWVAASYVSLGEGDQNQHRRTVNRVLESKVLSDGSSDSQHSSLSHAHPAGLPPNETHLTLDQNRNDYGMEGSKEEPSKHVISVDSKTPLSSSVEVDDDDHDDDANDQNDDNGDGVDGGDGDSSPARSEGAPGGKGAEVPGTPGSARNASSVSSTGSSLDNMDNIDERGKIQAGHMDRYCEANNNNNNNSRLADSEKSKYIRDRLYKHLLYDDKAKIVFCYVPKVGCSNWKRMFVVLNGILPPTPSTSRPSERILFSARRLHDLSPSQRNYRLSSYYKFMMVRNPLERLVSAYLNKIYRPFDPKHRYIFPDKEKYYMMKYFDKERLVRWAGSNQSLPISPSFSSFIQFITRSRSGGVLMNEHLETMTDLCQPCLIKYDFYANFMHLPEEANRVMDKFGIPHFYYRDVENHPIYTTAELLEFFYKSQSPPERYQALSALEARAKLPILGIPDTGLSPSILASLLQVYKDEVNFYAALYPKDQAFQSLAGQNFKSHI